jgi:PAS domain S-box-containing protein
LAADRGREGGRGPDLYRAIFETIGAAIAVVEEDTTISLVNPEFTRLSGYAKGEVEGRSWTGFVSKEDLGRMLEYHRKRRIDPDSAPRTYEFRGIDKGGNVRDVRVTVSMIPGTGRSVACLLDVTDLKGAERRAREAEEEYRALSMGLAEELLRVKLQMEAVSRLREELRRAPDVSTGFDSILENAMDALGMEAGAIFLIDREGKALGLRAFKSRIEGLAVRKSYPLDGAAIESRATREGARGSRAVGEGEVSLLGTNSIHYAPIIVGDDVRGLLVLGSRSSRALSESDMAILNSFAELASNLLSAHSLRVSPIREAGALDRPFNLELGEAYLVKDDVGRAFEVFLEAILSGLEGLCITREYPPKVRRKYGLERTPVVWLTDERAEGERTVKSLQDISIMIDGFLGGGGKVVLLDGVEYLITNHGFESVIRFLQLTRSRVERKGSVLIVPLFEGALDPRQVRLMEREMKPLPSDRAAG